MYVCENEFISFECGEILGKRAERTGEGREWKNE